MKLDLYRKYRKNGYTIGLLSIDGKFICNTLEDPDRGLTNDMSLDKITTTKIKGNTAIPTGTYTITITESPRFKKLMPLLANVKGFSGVRIHSGNTAKDTEGCILCGMNTEVGRITNSRYWTDRVYDYIRKGLNQGMVQIKIHW